MVREAPFVKAHCLSEHCHTKVTTLAGVLFLCQEKDRQRKQIIQLHPPPPPETGKVQRDKALLKRCFLNICIFLEQHSNMRTCK